MTREYFVIKCNIACYRVSELKHDCPGLAALE